MAIGPNFELVTELQLCIRRDFPVATDTLLDPFSATPLVDGEWLILDANYKLARDPGNITSFNYVSGTTEGVIPQVFPLFVEKGRYDTQAIRKATIIQLGMYEAETAIATVAGLAVGDSLTVNDVNVLGVATRRGLAKASASGAGRVVVGYVSKIVGTTKVRFVHFGNQKF